MPKEREWWALVMLACASNLGPGAGLAGEIRWAHQLIDHWCDQRLMESLAMGDLAAVLGWRA
jgi:hypothetical protein